MCRSHNSATAMNAPIATARVTSAGVGQPSERPAGVGAGSVVVADACEVSGVDANAGVVDDGIVVAAAPIGRPRVATTGKGRAPADVAHACAVPTFEAVIVTSPVSRISSVVVTRRMSNPHHLRRRAPQCR